MLRLEEKPADTRDPGAILFAARSSRGLHHHSKNKTERNGAGYPIDGSHASSCIVIPQSARLYLAPGVGDSSDKSAGVGYAARPPPQRNIFSCRTEITLQSTNRSGVQFS
jgi:hypothetical protein